MAKRSHDDDVEFIKALAELLSENDLSELQVKRDLPRGRQPERACQPGKCGGTRGDPDPGGGTCIPLPLRHQPRRRQRPHRPPHPTTAIRPACPVLSSRPWWAPLICRPNPMRRLL